MKSLILFAAIILSLQVRGQSFADEPVFIDISIVDTSFYETGKVKTTTIHFTSTPNLFSFNKTRLLKTVYQYDQCGNLRNVSKVYKVYVDPNSYGIMNPSSYLFVDEPIKDLVCDTLWVKPLIIVE